MPVDYEYACIYKIFSKSAGLVYYGSTCQKVSMRVAGHRAHFKKWKQTDGLSLYCSSFKVLECDDWGYERVIKCPCTCKEELHKIEGKYIRENECVNLLVAGRSNKEYLKEYYENNKERIKEYYQDNKEKIKEYQKEYYKKYYEENGETVKENHKKYYEKNKKYYEEYQKKYYEKRKVKATCECGAIVAKKYLTRHKKTKKHLKQMNKL